MTRVADGEFGKIMGQFLDAIERVRTGGVPVERAKQILAQFRGNLTVDLTDLTWEKAIKMLKESGCEVYLHSNFDYNEHLPTLSEDQKTKTEAVLRKQKNTTTNREWLDILDNNEEGKNKFAHPLVALALAIADPTLQEETPIFTIWYDDNSQLWYLSLGVCGGGRYLGVRRDGLGGYWIDGYRAVAVAK